MAADRTAAVVGASDLRREPEEVGAADHRGAEEAPPPPQEDQVAPAVTTATEAVAVAGVDTTAEVSLVPPCEVSIFALGWDVTVRCMLCFLFGDREDNCPSSHRFMPHPSLIQILDMHCHLIFSLLNLSCASIFTCHNT